MLKEELYGNYEDSVKDFNKQYVERREMKRVSAFDRKSKISQEVKMAIDDQLVCSYDLEFLDIYMLSKNNYIPLMVDSYRITSKIADSRHFTLLLKLNDTKGFTPEEELSGMVKRYFSDQKYKIENIIFELE